MLYSSVFLDQIEKALLLFLCESYLQLRSVVCFWLKNIVIYSSLMELFFVYIINFIFCLYYE